MKFKNIIYGIICFLIYSCTSDDPRHTVSFYHWKENFEVSETYKNALDQVNAKKIYLHYFDIEKFKHDHGKQGGIFPSYVLKDIGEEYKSYEIIPVVYITNAVMLDERLKVEDLVGKIVGLVDQISLRHFNKKSKIIQIDCDWTQSSRDVYFRLLEGLKKHYEINVTIRLHQIKYPNKTGVPPVNQGTLMLYNVGDLKDNEHNSILESDIVKQYINTDTSYPMDLNLGLPLFSQTVVSNNENQIKIIRNSVREDLENDMHFKQVNPMNYSVVNDTLFRGFYLSKGFNLKLEELSENEIIESIRLIEESQLKIREVIFYHLDEPSLLNIDLEQILLAL